MESGSSEEDDDSEDEEDSDENSDESDEDDTPDAFPEEYKKSLTADEKNAANSPKSTARRF